MRPMMTLTVLIAVLLVHPAHAGTRTDPEIRDDLLDVSSPILPYISHTIGAPEIDIVVAWFEVSPSTVAASWEVADATHRIHAEESRSLVMIARCNSAELEVGWHDGPATERMPATSFAYAWVAHPDGSQDFAEVPFLQEGNIIRVEFPRGILPCTKLTHTSASSILALPDGSGGRSGGGVAWWRDAAPNNGYGREVSLE